MVDFVKDDDGPTIWRKKEKNAEVERKEERVWNGEKVYERGKKIGERQRRREKKE